MRDLIENADKLVIDNGIKSKSRVSEHGEVYTPENIVKDMLDLIKEESYKIESTVLEPACGNGNFLVEIIARKLDTAAKEEDVKLAVFKSYAAVYGIDILADNVRESRQRMLAKIIDNTELCERLDKESDENKQKLVNVLKFVMDQNIILGNALTGHKVFEDGTESTEELFNIVDWKMDGETVNATYEVFNSLKDSAKLGSVEYPFITGHYLELSTDNIAEDEFDGYDF